jgi:CDP-diacylglycerol--serine O-phosphatidyltransferase
MKKHVPNILTILNLLCGSAAVVFALEGNWQWTAYLMLLAAVFDFMDGLAAKLLKAYSEVGKHLDSLADIVTFGLLPAVMLYKIYREILPGTAEGFFSSIPVQWIMLSSVLIIPAFSAIRLARFNITETDGSYFYGLATPANALFWTGMYWQIMKEGLVFQHQVSIWFLLAIQLILSFHLILPIPMFSLKFEHFKVKGNIIRYLFLIISILVLSLTGVPGLSIVILVYILVAVINLLLARLSGS